MWKDLSCGRALRFLSIEQFNTLLHGSRKRNAAKLRFRSLVFEKCEDRQLLASVPLAFNDQYATAVNTNLVVTTSNDVMENDTDVDGGSLTASVVANPSNGTLSAFGTNGTFTYVPTNNFSGLDSFTYKISDGTNYSNVATVRIVVGGNFGARTNSDEIPLNAMLHTGALTVAQPLTMDNVLVYRSDTVAVRPTVVLETSLLSSSSVPSSIDAQLTFGGISGSTVSYSTTGLSAGDPLRFVLQVDGSSLSTGYTITR